MQRLKDPKEVARKKKVHLDEVEALVKDLSRYGFVNCCRIEALLSRLLDEAQTPEERRSVIRLAARFESGCQAKFFNYLRRLVGLSDGRVDVDSNMGESGKEPLANPSTSFELRDSSRIKSKA